MSLPMCDQVPRVTNTGFSALVEHHKEGAPVTPNIIICKIYSYKIYYL